MKATVTTTSQTLPEILGESFSTLTDQKDFNEYQYVLTIQVIGEQDLYLENGAVATVAGGYKISNGNEVEIKYSQIKNFSLIADGADNVDVRFIVT